MVENSPLLRTVLVLVGMSAALFLVTALGQVIIFFGDIILVVFIAWIIATLLRRPADYLEQRLHWNRTLSRLLAFVAFLVPFAIVLAFLVPLTITQVILLAQTAPTIIADIPLLALKAQEALAGMGIDVDLEALVAQVPLGDLSNDVFGAIGRNTLAIATGIGDIVFKFLLTLVIAFYILVTGESTSNIFFRLVPEQYSTHVRHVFRQMDHTFTQYMRGMLVIGAIYAAGTFLVMTALGLPFALPISILAGFLIILPFIGDLIAISIPVLTALLTSTPGRTLVTLAILLIFQQVMTNIVSPRVLGKAVDLPAMLVLLAVIIGAKVAGFWGALLGVPLLAAFYYLVTAWVQERALHRAEAQAVELQD